MFRWFLLAMLLLVAAPAWGDDQNRSGSSADFGGRGSIGGKAHCGVSDPSGFSRRGRGSASGTTGSATDGGSVDKPPGSPLTAMIRNFAAWTGDAASVPAWPVAA
jgi:hypothetical protein